ncbi:heparin lyase I family protein [Gloeocapsa sp. BRSZ]
MIRETSVRVGKTPVPRLALLTFVTSVSLSLSATQAHARIIQEVTENTQTARSVEDSNSKGGSSCNKLTEVSSPIRAGQQAFRHWVDRCGERAEFATDRTNIGSTYWYGWSMLIPDEQLSDSYDILAQWATYPTPRNGGFECGANGSYIVRSGNSVAFKLQHKGDRTDIDCQHFPLVELSEIRGKWVDYVMQAKWTGNSDGFVKMWVKVGDAPYELKVDYQGRTF